MTSAAAPQPASRWTAGRIAAVTGGSILGLVAFCLLIGGVVLAFTYAFLRDDDGFFTTPTERLSTPTAALTAEGLDLGAAPGDDWAVEDVGGRIRVTAEMQDGAPVFVGIARERDLDAYLADVAHDELGEFDDSPTYTRSGGAVRDASPPTAQDFWVARASGGGEQTAEWEVRSGDWAAVVMRPDGARGVEADVSGGAKAGWILGVAFVLIAMGALGLGGAGALLWGGLRRRRTPATTPLADPHPGAVATTAYPVRLDARLDEPLSPWMWLVKWFLAIPHVVVLALLWIAVHVLTVIAFFAILFTGRYPQAIFDFNVGVLRWTWRVGWYAFTGIATDRYPPFTLQPAGYPCEIEVPHPARLSRGLVLVKWWLLAIPHSAILAAFLGGAWWIWDAGGPPGVLTVLVLVAGAVLLVTGRYPRDVFRLVAGINRWILRVAAYVLLMRDEYPPFRLEDEPPASGVSRSVAHRVCALTMPGIRR